ncbi:hypothetical protein DSM104299_03297 [Baekduia alba]|nr:hypothetical protein DSM104299_03297 [Baekduia alba]
MLRIRVALFLLLPLALVATGFAMVLTVDHQRDVAAHAADRTDAAHQLMLAMVDQETGLRGYVLSDRQAFLEPFYTGDRDGRKAEVEVRAEAGGDPRTLTLIGAFSELKTAWQIQAQNEIADRRNGDWHRHDLAGALRRKALMDRLRRISAHLNRRLDQRRNDDLDDAGRQAFFEVVGLILLLGVAAVSLITRERRQRRQAFQRELAYRQSQREFTDVIQVVRSEPEAHALVKRHLELSVPGARATVLKRNNSDNRLEPSTELPAGSPLNERLRDAEPASWATWSWHTSARCSPPRCATATSSAASAARSSSSSRPTPTSRARSSSPRPCAPRWRPSASRTWTAT